MNKYDELRNIIKLLRNPIDGCSWDKKQTSKSLVPNFIEELYETVEAIENDEIENLKEELGDLLMHILFQIEIAEEKNNFDDNEVFDEIINKLINRHPHIFKFKEKCNEQEVINNWERIKNEEKKNKRNSILDGIPKKMPALIVAYRMQEKASSVGFDWNSYLPVIEKIKEETNEIMEAVKNEDKENLEEEIGDLLFSVVNFSRFFNIDSEMALRKTINKFEKRFNFIEDHYKKENRDIYKSNLEELDELWNKAKKNK